MNEKGFIQLLIEARFDREADRWVAGSPDLGVYSQGDTPQESFRRSLEAITLFLNHETEQGRIAGILAAEGVKFIPAALHGRPIEDSLIDRLRDALTGIRRFPATLPFPTGASAAC